MHYKPIFVLLSDDAY